jgi:uncharacterized membrane protein SpoIIM required for sporulation
MKTKDCSILIVVSATIYFSTLLVGLSPVLPVLDSNNSVYPQITTHNIVLKKIHCISFTCILLNNFEISIVQIFGGFLIGIPTFLIEAYNALFFGHLIKSCVLYKLPLDKIVILTLPHGIFEIPAIIIAGAAGFKIPYEIIRYLAGKKEQILTKEDIKEYLTLALISIILIVIAAWIEANVTLKIAKAMLKTKGI